MPETPLWGSNEDNMFILTPLFWHILKFHIDRSLSRSLIEHIIDNKISIILFIIK